MKHNYMAEQNRCAKEVPWTLDCSTGPSHPTIVFNTPVKGLMEVTDILDSADCLIRQKGSSKLGGVESQKGQVARELKLSECLKELAAFQISVMEEDEKDHLIRPKDLNTTLFSLGPTLPNGGPTNDCTIKDSKDAAALSRGATRKHRDAALAKGQPKEVLQKPWSFSTKSTTVSEGKIGKVNRVTGKTPTLTTRSRQVVKHSSPLAFGRRLSLTPEKKRQSLVKSPISCKRQSKSPEEKSRPVESKKLVHGGQLVGRTKPWERTSPLVDGKTDGKMPKLTERQKEILKKVTASPAIAKAKVKKEKANGLRSSFDLSVAGRRSRRLSQVLRNENNLMLQNQQYTKELQHLRRDFADKDQEAERVRSAGMLLKQLCANQAEELRAFKGAFPTILKEMSDLRDDYHKQENELQLAHATKFSLQAEISNLQERVQSLTSDIKQTRALNTILAERVQQAEKKQCPSCRLNSTKKPLKTEMSPSSTTKRAGPHSRTPQRPQDAKAGKNCTPKQPATPNKEVDKACQPENKRSGRKQLGELSHNSTFAHHESTHQVSPLHALPSKGGFPVDVLKNRINSLLLTTSQALQQL